MSAKVIAFFDARFQESGPLWEALGRRNHWRWSLEPRPARSFQQSLRMPSRLGAYDLARPEMAASVVMAAREAGLAGFALDLYRAREGYLTGAECLDPWCDGDFGLAFRWDNGLRGASSATMDWEGHRRDLAAVVAAMRPWRHATLGGRPVLVIQRPHTLAEPALTVTLLQEEARRAGLPGLYIIANAAEETPRLGGAGFGALLDPDPAEWVSCDVVTPDTGFTILQALAGYEDAAVVLDTVLNYRTFSCSRMVNRSRRGKVLPRVMPAFSNWPDHDERGAVNLVNTFPSLYNAFMRKSISVVSDAFAEDERAVFLDSWNYWRYGSQIEPETRRGDSLLRETRSAINWGRYVARTQVPVHKAEAVTLDSAARARIDTLCSKLMQAVEAAQ